jgi:hypothetical protein
MMSPVYHLNITSYQQLLETGQGELIYGKSFPPNSSVFLSEQARYFAVMQAYYLIKNFSDSSGASAKDLVEFIKEYGETISDIERDIMSGLLTDSDFNDIVRELDGDEE